MCFAIFYAVRQQALVSIHSIVNKRNAGYPITVAYIAIKHALYFILLATKIPEEISQVHKARLIIDKVFKIVRYIGPCISTILIFINIKGSIFQFTYIHKIGVVVSMALVVTHVPHAREYHFILWHKHIMAVF